MLLPRLSSKRPAEVRAGTVLQEGQRLAVRWSPRKEYPAAKIEFCIPRPLVVEKCYTLAHSVPNSGRAQDILVRAGLPRERGVIRVRARKGDGRLAFEGTKEGPQIVEQNAVLVTSGQRIAGGPSAEKDIESAPVGGEESESTAGESGSPPEQSVTAEARFLSPQNGHQVQQGTPLNARVQLRWTAGDDPACQQWKIDGRLLTTADWVGGQNPDASDGPCSACNDRVDNDGDGLSDLLDPQCSAPDDPDESQ